MTKRMLLIAATLLFTLFIAGCTGITTTEAVTTGVTTVTTVTTATTATTGSVTTTVVTTATTTTTTAIPTYDVSFVANGGTDVLPQVVERNDHVEAVDSVLEDYSLEGWYSDETLTTLWDFETDVVTADLVLYAKWVFAYAPEGLGTELDPYLVATLKDLEILRDGRFVTTEEQYFLLTVDLEIASDFASIDGVAFNGDFDGGHHLLTIVGDAGLFFQNNGTIHDFTIDGDLETETASSLGMVAHHNFGTIEAVSAIGYGVRSRVGTIGVFADGIGGAGAIVGTNEADGLVITCESRTNVQAVVGGGGIAGTNHGTIEQCAHWGTVGESQVIYISAAEATVGKFSYAGGIAGINYASIIACQNRGRVFAQRAGNAAEDPTNGNRVFGGIAGYNGPDGLVTECYNAYGTAGATVHADRIVGGIVGHNFGVVSYSYSPANIGGRANIGGIVGLQDESEGNVESVSFCWTNSNFKSDGNEDDELGAFDVLLVSNWYNLAKYADNSYYHGTRGLVPTGEGNVSGASVSLDMTALLNAGLTVGDEKWVSTAGSSSGNAKTKLAWQQATATFVVDGVETKVVVPMGNTPVFAAPLKDGYAFDEWRTIAADPETVWNVGGLTADGKFYAVFEAIEYAITYQLDGGENDVLNPVVYTIESAEIVLAPATRPGCAFVGWYDVLDVKIESIPTGSTGEFALHAVWEITVPYLTVVFASTDLPAQTLLELAGATIVLATLEQAGYEFLGWSLDGTNVAFGGGTSLVYVDLAASAVLGVVTLTPLFEEIFTYTVSFNPNGATGMMETLTYRVDSSYALPNIGFYADNVVFYGWLFNGTIYDNGEAVENLVASGLNAELVALWTGGEIVLNGNFNVGGTMTSSDSKTYTSDVWSVYRNGTTNVPSLACAIADGDLTIDATIAAGARSINFYIVVQVSLPGIAVGSTYVVTFDASVSDATSSFIGAYIRSKASGSTSYASVTSLAEFNTLGTATATFSTVLTATGAIAEGSTYYLILPLASVAGGLAGTFSWTIDNVSLVPLGPAA